MNESSMQLLDYRHALTELSWHHQQVPAVGQNLTLFLWVRRKQPSCESRQWRIITDRQSDQNSSFTVQHMIIHLWATLQPATRVCSRPFVSPLGTCHIFHSLYSVSSKDLSVYFSRLTENTSLLSGDVEKAQIDRRVGDSPSLENCGNTYYHYHITYYTLKMIIIIMIAHTHSNIKCIN